ncbi:hypothetical protein GSI_04057 [Ganoderma sinense ZZ0214-1]|uniref:Protein kinase domain-containing protein n=1 Tax=Ganoderma sinense ZZ0214-1 TaxID=1077348 RepID=A0A2G8SI38_9APHY|nr:hypothetical protein GSI_04057 [Ganoderma sinense ZZ0214-1]
MSSQVRFAEGTNFDSPAKPFNGNSSHTSTKPDLARNRAELCFNMHGKITIVEYSEFLDHFLPSFNHDKKKHDNIFEHIDRPKGEPDMYKELPKAINNAKICPGFKVVANPYQADKTDTTQQAVDLGLYRTKQAPKREKDKTYPAVDWFDIDLPMECKADETEQDAFDETQPNGEPTADKRQDALGQALSYVELIVKHQHRMFVFMIFFLGNSVRIARFDRSGVFVTRKLDYNVHGTILVDFLYRYSRLSDAERGYDPTVTRILPNTPLYQAMLARANNEVSTDRRDYVRKLFQKSLNDQWPWWKIEVHTQAPQARTRNQRNQTVILNYAVGMPHFQALGVAGRGTRGYVAVPVDEDDTIAPNANFVYLKDAWRVDYDDIDQEGVTLKFLNDEGVPFVPTLVCHGDLPDQVTISQDHWRDFHPDEKRLPLKRHQHYRLVVKEVGLPLEDFRNKSTELCEALYHCLLAHEEAYDAGIIHRDISAGNILLCMQDDGEWYGLLNDWELSKKVDSLDSEARQPDRTGTWQYMSAHALNDPYRKIVVQDELEAFFHVLLYYAIRFLPHNLAENSVGKFLHDYFDAYTPGPLGHYTCGRAKIDAMEHGVISLRTYHGGEDAKNVALRFRFPTAEEIQQLSSQNNKAAATPPPSPRCAPSSPAPRSSPCPAGASHPQEPSPSPPSSPLFGSDLTPLPSEDTMPPTEDKTKEKDHPLNEIIQKLLSWFSAYYALDGDVTSAASSTDVKTFVPFQSTRLQRVMMRRQDAKRGRSRPADNNSKQLLADDVATQPAVNAKDIARLKELAENLASHTAVIELFEEAFKNEWPEIDKGADKKPKDGYVSPKSQVLSGSTTATGSKRRSMDDAQEDKPGPSKRSRT